MADLDEDVKTAEPSEPAQSDDDLAAEAANDVAAGLASEEAPTDEVEEGGQAEAAPEPEPFEGYDLDGERIEAEKIRTWKQIAEYYGSDTKFDEWRNRHLQKSNEFDRQRKEWEQQNHPVRQMAEQFQQINQRWQQDPVSYAAESLKLAVSQGILPPQALQIAENLVGAFTETGLYNPAEVQARYYQQQQAQLQQQQMEAAQRAQGQQMLAEFERGTLKRFMTDEEKELLTQAVGHAARFNPNSTLEQLWGEVEAEMKRRHPPKPVAQQSVPKVVANLSKKPVVRGGAAKPAADDDLDALLGDVQKAFAHR